MTNTDETGSRSLDPRDRDARDRDAQDRDARDRDPRGAGPLNTGSLSSDPRLADGVEHRIRPARTSVAAALALAFGVSALTCVLSVVLFPIAFVLGIIGLVLGVVGFKMAKRVGITGKGIALSGLLLSLVSVVLAGTVALGITTVLNDDRAVSRLEEEVEDLRGQLPSDIEVPQP